jgi:hypothetical protein
MPFGVVERSNAFAFPAEEAVMVTEPVLLAKTFPAVFMDKLIAAVSMRVPGVPMSAVPVPPAPSLRLMLVAVSSSPGSSTMPPVPIPLSVDVRLRTPMLPTAEPMFPATVICPLPLPFAVVARSKIAPLPADDPVRLTEPRLLRYTLPPVFADKLVAVVRIRELEDPISPVPFPVSPSLRVTVPATSCPPIAAIPPTPDGPSDEVNWISAIVPVAAATPPLTIICPLPPAFGAAIKSNVLALPAEDAARVTVPMLLINTFAAVLADKVGVAVNNLDGTEEPMLPEPDDTETEVLPESVPAV